MLAVEGLNAWWGHAHALFDVRLQVDEGELVVLQGLNGAGKSTLLQSLIGMEDFQAARWLMDGEVPEQAGNEHPTIAAMGLFEASDAPVNIAPAGPGQFESLCQVAGLTGLLDDPRFFDPAARYRNRDALNAKLSSKIRERTA